MDKAGQQALKEAAEAGGGEYSTVEDDADLREYFDQQKHELFNQWVSWSIDSHDFISQQQQKKREELEKLAFTGKGLFFNVEEKENKHLNDALDFLEKQEKISSKESSKASNLILKRSDKIDHYRRDRFHTINVIIRENALSIKEMVRKKSIKMRNQN